MDNNTQINMVRRYRRDGKTFDDFARDLRSFKAPEDEIKAAWEAYDRLPEQIRKLDKSTTLKDPRMEKILWYDGPQEEDRYWPALKQALLQKDWKPEAIELLDSSSTKILSFLEAPGSATIKTRGLVVGYVQSGKTANYSAVIAKAADAGYRLFIVLSGLTDQLRNQTQRRLAREITDLNAQNQRGWHALTTSDRDFQAPAGNPSSLLINRDLRLLAVVKKNAPVLRRLHNWLRRALRDAAGACPVLVIDDEADQASVNASTTPDKRTAINQLILSILETMPKTAYIGYTATPFANVFIDLNDNNLYPSDFIIDLPRSPDYSGTERIFGRELLPMDEKTQQLDGLDMIRITPDEEISDLKPSQPKERADFLPVITESLEDALAYFWLATAARRVRDNKKEHSTMLIHTTLYTEIHNRFQPLLSQHQARFRQGLKTNNQTLLARLRQQWEDEQQAVSSTELGLVPVAFDDLLPELINTVHETDIVVENSRSQVRLEYHDADPRTVVVVGGNILSRGLTLEGLIVSFFVRSANAYDTLLQMGRWFGYRPGYEDLPRIWMTAELKDFFFAMATVEQEIREDIRLYELEGISPSQFGVRVRSHPSLEITSRLKMQRTATPCDVSFAESFHQTILFHHTDAAWLGRNLQAARTLISQIQQAGIAVDPREQKKIFREVPVHLIRMFLEQYQFHELNRAFSSELLRGYIDEQNKAGDLKYWNVVIVTRGLTQNDGPEKLLDLGLGQELPLLNRSRLVTASAVDYASLGVIANGYSDIVADLNLPEEEIKKATPSELKIKRPAGTGLLLLYPIDKNSVARQTGRQNRRNFRTDLHAADHIIGVAFAFPRTSRPAPQGYMTNASIAPREEEEILDVELEQTS